MKKISIISLSIIFLIFLFEENKCQTTNFGLYGGLNLSYVTGIDTNYFEFTTKSKKLKAGENIQLLFDIRIGYMRYIQLGAIYSNEGVRIKTVDYEAKMFDSGLVKITKIRKNVLPYLKIPLIWKQNWGDWYTVLGGYGAVPILPKAKWRDKYEFYDFLIDTLNGFSKLSIRNYDMGIILGMGLQFPLNNYYDWVISINYYHSFLALYPGDIKQNRIYNRTFNISTGIIFNNKGYKYKYKSRR